jgi:hypothetical protein
MKKYLVALLLLVSITAQASTVFSIPQLARDAVNETFRQLEWAGVLRLDPYDPSLPYPQVSAIEALHNPRTGAFAYYDEEAGLGMTYVFKSRQGGNRHRISFTPDHVEFVTPYLGQVAHVNRFKTVQGWMYHFYCRSQYVDRTKFDHCVRSYFINVIRQQMERRF